MGISLGRPSRVQKVSVNGGNTMKKILLAICLLFSFATFSFAEDVLIIPNMTKPEPGKIDLYIVTDNYGRSKTVAVIDSIGNSYAIIGSGGKTTIITKFD